MTEAMMSNDNNRDSLIERAAEVYDFGSVFRPSEPAPVKLIPVELIDAVATPAPVSVESGPETGSPNAIDRDRLRAEGFILPDAPVGALAEEFRLVKRQLLLRPGADEPSAKDRMILICSAQPNEGKTFCSVNLALSLASERDREVLLVDADVAKPQVLSTLGLSGSAGLIDAVADPGADIEDFVIQTDIPKLSVLPAGRASHNDTELLSSARAVQLIASLAANNPRRIVILDSAPALAASPAAVLAHHVGRVLVIVRADRTKEADLREAIGLLDGCDDISLLLNGASFFGTNRTYGSYYGADA